jgi:aerobic carbon-monoxide dehydrogenase large subunit
LSANGSRVRRKEDPRLLRGDGRYVADWTVDGELHAAVVRSAHAHARIVSIDVEAARKAPGVVDILLPEDVAHVERIPVRVQLKPIPSTFPHLQPHLAQGKVKYVGEPIAVVVASNRYIAEDALELIEVEYEPLPAVTAGEAAIEDGAPLLVEETGSNIAAEFSADVGDVDRAFAEADVVVSDVFTTNRHGGVPMETRGLLAQYDPRDARLTVWGPTKVPHANRNLLARFLGISEDTIRFVEPDVGGGFGVRGEFYPEDFLIPFAARKLARAVKWTEDRRENLLSSNHAREVDCEIEIACEKDGRIVALRGKAWVDMGAYLRANGSVPPRNVAQFLSGPYKIPNIHMESFAVLTNKTPVGTYRGPGRFEADFFRERLFDMAAKDLGLDPVEFRRRNLPSPEEMPFALATVNNPEKKEDLDSGDYSKALDRCLTEFNWTEKRKLQGKLIDGRYHGVAVTCFIEGGAAGPRESARIVVDPDGTVSVFVGSANVGQGLETVCLQIASDALGLPMERLRIFHGSTPYVKEGFGAYHSRSVVMGGTAIQLAAKNLRDQIAGAALSEVDLKKLAPLSAEGVFHNHKHTYAYGSAAAHVAVDPKTGHVELIDYVTVEDIGRIINPLTAVGQAIGAVVQGLGGVFLEHLQYDENGQFLTASLADYLLPSATDFPRIRAFVTEDSPSPINPMGAKGAGEGGIVPVGGVVANAVAAALAPLGVEPRSLPLSPPRVWELIQTAAR